MAEIKGIDMGKKVWGRKRHALVDVEGHLMEVKVTAASDSDLAGGKKLLAPMKEQFPRLKLLWGDSHYGGSLIDWVKEQLGWDVEVVHGLGTVPNAATEQTSPKEKRAKRGFKVLPRRWVVERSFAWITRWRRLCRDHEGLPRSAQKLFSNSRRADACSPISFLLRHE